MDNLKELDLDSDLSLPTSGIMSPVLPEVCTTYITQNRMCVRSMSTCNTSPFSSKLFSLGIYSLTMSGVSFLIISNKSITPLIQSFFLRAKYLPICILSSMEQ